MQKKLSRKSPSTKQLIPSRPTSIKPLNLPKRDKSGQPSRAATTRETNTAIPRNVNFFRHLTSDYNANEPTLQWALKLRSPSCFDLNHKMEATSVQPFSVSEKPIKCQEQHKMTVDLNTKNQLYKVNHLLMNRIGETPSHGVVHFETNLRSYGCSSEKLMGLEKKWTTIPYREKKDKPIQMYPSLNETRRIKNWSTKNLNIRTHSAFDGYNNYPQYDDLDKPPNKNLSGIAHLFTTSGQNIPLLTWQLSMRNYDNPKSQRSTSRGPLEELKNLRKPKKKE